MGVPPSPLSGFRMRLYCSFINVVLVLLVPTFQSLLPMPSLSSCPDTEQIFGECEQLSHSPKICSVSGHEDRLGIGSKD